MAQHHFSENMLIDIYNVNYKCNDIHELLNPNFLSLVSD